MKQGLSLRVSQHLALTPQLQQSIRLLQLSTLELSQEVEQMLDENPFLEATPEESAREEPEPAPAERLGEHEREIEFGADASEEARAEAEDIPAADAEAPGWDGEGSAEAVPDDGEWGGEPAARPANGSSDEEVDATDLASG